MRSGVAASRGLAHSRRRQFNRAEACRRRTGRKRRRGWMRISYQSALRRASQVTNRKWSVPLAVEVITYKPAMTMIRRRLRAEEASAVEHVGREAILDLPL